MKFKKSLLISLLGILVVLSLTAVSAGWFDSNDDPNANSDVAVENISIVSEGYGLYEVNCAITPKKDFSYLEMQVVFYDSDGAIVGSSPMVWNMNNIKKDQLIKASGSAITGSDSINPSKAEVFIIDTAFGDTDDAIFSENVTMS